MEIVDFLLDGLEAALELERELGVRSVEFDRELLTVPPAVAPSATPIPKPAVIQAAAVKPVAEPKTVSLVFLHDRPLSPGGVEMMAKILNALGRPDAPIVIAPPVPRAKVTVVLGGRALKKYFPEMKGEPGQWRKTEEKADVLITYTPEYILRFGTVTPAVKKMKADMWCSLKAVTQRLKNA